MSKWAEFVAEYPMDANTRETRLEWERIPEEDQTRVLEGLRKWKRSQNWQEKNGRFIPYPVNFLRRELWKVDPPGGEAKTGPAERRHVPSYDSKAFEEKARGPIKYEKRK